MNIDGSEFLEDTNRKVRTMDHKGMADAIGQNIRLGGTDATPQSNTGKYVCPHGHLMENARYCRECSARYDEASVRPATKFEER
jgi:hypothetical protein